MIDTVGRFTGKAVGFARYREPYDAELILRSLREWCGLTPQWLVADIATGTGMLAEVFLSNGNEVIGVEPNAEMRAVCVVGVELRDGTAEATGLAGASVDLVVVGRALHWFQADEAFLEFGRILRPQGWVAIISEGRSDAGRRENVELEELLRKTSGDSRSTRERYAVYMTLAKRFEPGTYHSAEAAGEMRLDWDGLRGFVQSLSYSPLETDPRYAEFEAGLRGLFDAHAVDGEFRLATNCYVGVGQLPI